MKAAVGAAAPRGPATPFAGSFVSSVRGIVCLPCATYRTVVLFGRSLSLIFGVPVP